MRTVHLDTPRLLDGGLATELEARGHDLRDPLWSARLLHDAPDEIRATHQAFFEAGAQVATTASYQASFDGFAARGFTHARTRALLHRSVELARAAADAIGGSRWVAASIGPYGAALADGSEYHGRYGLTVRQLLDFHRPRVEALVEAAPDVLALETIPDVNEAEAMLDAVADVNLPVWLSYSIQGGRTCAGQPLREAFSIARGMDNVCAVGVNCCAPQDTTAAISEAVRSSGKPAVSYPNSGERWDHLHRAWTGPTLPLPQLAHEWYTAGARLIGGCCRVGPAETAALYQQLVNAHV